VISPVRFFASILDVWFSTDRLDFNGFFHGQVLVFLRTDWIYVGFFTDSSGFPLDWIFLVFFFRTGLVFFRTDWIQFGFFTDRSGFLSDWIFRFFRSDWTGFSSDGFGFLLKDSVFSVFRIVWFFLRTGSGCLLDE